MIIGFIVGVVVCIALFDIIFMIGANAIKDAINQSCNIALSSSSVQDSCFQATDIGSNPIRVM